jgi:hypothetical protein
LKFLFKYFVSFAKGAEITWAEPSAYRNGIIPKASSSSSSSLRYKNRHHQYHHLNALPLTESHRRRRGHHTPNAGPRDLGISTPRHGVPAVWTARHQVAA